MRANVFTDEALGRQAGRYVWLSIDGEKSKNAAIRRKLNITAFPTFFVIDPEDEHIALRWIGGFNAQQFPHLLDAGEVAVRGGKSVIDRDVVRADSLYAAGLDSLAAVTYEQVLAEAPQEYVHRARCVESLVFVLSEAQQFEACAQRALDEMESLGHTVSAANVAALGLDAASQLPKENPNRMALARLLESQTRAFVADTTLPLSGDDRSGLYITLIGAHEADKDSVGARRITEQWSAFLDKAAAAAHTPEQRAVYDSHRLSAYLELGQADRAIPMLQQSERDFPDDYNPPARLAVAYRDLKRWDDALAASDRAMAKAYGPRKLNLYRTRVDILLGREEKDRAKQTLEEAIAYAEALPAGQRSQASIDSLKKRLDTLK